MSTNFNTFMDRIDRSFWEKLAVEHGVPKSLEKGETFIQAGAKARYMAFIKSGAMKYVACSEDGTEHVVGLIFPGEFVADFPFSFIEERPSALSIVAVTGCELHCLPTRDLRQRLKNDDDIFHKFADATNAIFETVYDRYISLYTRSAAQRYDELLTHHPDLFNQFSLKDIASFLNVTPTHLSRLRGGV